MEISIQLDYFWCLTSHFHDTEHNNMFLIHNYNREYANSEKHLLLIMTVILEISMQFLVSSPGFLLQHIIQNPIILSVLKVPL